MGHIIFKQFFPDPHQPEIANGRIRKCYLGMSVLNPYIVSRKLSKILNWVTEHYDECILLVGDYLHRHNEEIYYGKTPEQAAGKVQLLGHLIDLQLAEVLKHQKNNIFKIVHWEDFIKDNKEFDASYEMLTTALKKSEPFRSSLKQCAEGYIEKIIQRNNMFLEKEDAVKVSQRYLIEEMAVFDCLIGDGYQTQIYPGEVVPILKEIISNKFPFLHSKLRNAIYIEGAIS
jgi:tRNA-dependent cyclodipeptide synthase